MKLQIFSVKDVKSDSFMNHGFPARNRPAAIRAFADAVNNKNGVMFTHPEDYALYDIATFDDETGQYESLEVPILLAIGNQVIKKDENILPIRPEKE